MGLAPVGALDGIRGRAVVQQASASYCKGVQPYTFCKGCDPYGQLLCGMLQVPGAMHTLHKHSMAAHRRSTGAYNTPVATQWLGQR